MAGSTPIYGFPYPQSTDLVADYPTLGQELATDVETVISGLGSGLNIVTPTSIANSGGSASASGGAVTFTGVTSISLNGVFTSTYDNYVMVMVATAAAGNPDLSVRMRTAGTDNTTSNYLFQFVYGTGTTPATAGGTSQTSFRLQGGTQNYGAINLDIYSPNLSASTSFNATGPMNPLPWVAGGAFNASTVFDGLTVATASSNITGKMRIYGYKNS